MPANRVVTSALALLLFPGTAMAESFYFRNVTPTAPGASASPPAAGGNTVTTPGLSFSGLAAHPLVGTGAGGRFAATGLQGGLTYAYEGSLPDGISIAADGSLAGTFSKFGSFSATVTAKDASGRTASAVLAIDVTAPGVAPAFSVSQSAATISGVPYSAPAVINAGDVSKWSLANAPGWLAVGGTGITAGTPPLGLPSFGYTVVANDVYGRQARSTQSVTLDQPTARLDGVSPAYLPGDVVAARIITNLPAPSFVLEGQAPTWAVFDATQGTLTGKVAAGATTASLVVVTSQAAANLRTSVPLNVTAVSVSASGIPASTYVGKAGAVTGAVSATAGSGWSYDISGKPAWLHVDAASGAITSDVVTAPAGTLNLVPTATRNGVTVSGTAKSMTVAASPPLAVATQPAGKTIYAGDTYATTMTVSGGDGGALTWTLAGASGGGAPSWLTQSCSGSNANSCTVTASPPNGTTAGGSYTLTVRDATGNAVTSDPFGISIGTPVAAQTVLPSGVTGIEDTSAEAIEAAYRAGSYSGYAWTIPNGATTLVTYTFSGPVYASKYFFGFRAMDDGKAPGVTVYLEYWNGSAWSDANGGNPIYTFPRTITYSSTVGFWNNISKVTSSQFRLRMINLPASKLTSFSLAN
jgi:hypothetical protein